MGGGGGGGGNGSSSTVRIIGKEVVILKFCFLVLEVWVFKFQGPRILGEREIFAWLQTIFYLYPSVQSILEEIFFFFFLRKFRGDFSLLIGLKVEIDIKL